MPSPCPDDDALLELAQGALADAARPAIATHLLACDACREAVAALVRLGRTAPELAPTLAGDAATTAPEPATRGRAVEPWAPGTRVGRFVVRRLVGHGAMGAVYAADDPELGRTVALKIVRRDTDGDAAALEERFRVEGAAMARAAHPAVVTVFDVGRHGGEVYLAMEYIDGGTLTAWLETPRTWRAIVAMFVAAGRGLAAAHAAGIVHRDFKPDNVLVDRDGAPHVADFGVARSRRWGDDAALTSAPSATPAAAPGLTHGSVLVGTPLYMSPEQLAGQPATPASDQFSFFVALATAVTGARPFAGATLEELRAAIAAGPRLPRASRRDLPTRLWPVLERGLAAQPDQRHPSVAAALAALERAAAPRTRPWLAPALGAGLVAAAATALWVTRPTADPCRVAGAAIAGAWSPARAAALAPAFAKIDPTIGADTARRVTDALAAYGQRWHDASVAACRAARVTGEQSDADLTLRTRCLDRAKQRLTALATTLAAADRDGVAHAVDAVAALPPVEACADLAALAAPIPPPANADRARVEAIERRVAEVEAGYATGAYAAADALAGSVVTDAVALGYRPLEAEARFARARVRSELGDHADERAELEATVNAAVAGHADRLAARAAIELVITVSHRLSDPEAAAALATSAAAAVERAGGGDELADALARARAILAFTRGDTTAARTGFAELARRLAERSGPTSPELLPALRGLAAVAGAEMAGADLLAVDERILAIQRATLAPDHPDIATTLASTGYAQYLTGQFAAAVDTYRDAIARREHYLGADHVDVAGLYGQLASAYGFLGRSDEAVAAARHAVDVLRGALGDGHRRTVAAIITLAQMRETTGDYAAARTEVIGVIDRMRGEATANPLLGSALTTLGLLELDLGAADRALAALREADGLEAPARAQGGGSGELSRLLGEAYLAAGDAHAAVPPLLRAHDQLAAATAAGDDVQLLRADAVLAEALFDSGSARPRGRALAVTVEARMRDEPRLAGEHARLAAWMKRHGIAPAR